jgi:hypothetical protein
MNESDGVLDEFHRFGSRWFCLQMEDTLSTQSSILKQISLEINNPELKKVLPLIMGLHTTSTAILCLRKDLLLNESHVLMRLLFERALNLCYLLTSPLDNKTVVSSCATTEAKKNDDLVEIAKDFRFQEVYDSEALEAKVKAVEENTSIPVDFLRLVISFHYPIASHALSGSVFGAIAHFKHGDGKDGDFPVGDLTLLLFQGATLLHEVIKLLGVFGVPRNLLKTSDAADEKAKDLITKSRRPTAEQVQNFYGWWQSLSDYEHNAIKEMGGVMRDYEAAFGACMDSGVKVPVLAKTDEGSLRLPICALYLKRMLNDFRSVWVMIQRGNTAQAGSIASSLFENALLIQCLAENEERAVRFNKTPAGRCPWNVRTMCGFINGDNAKRTGSAPSKEVEKAMYEQYSWLCQIKHPTLECVVHESGSTQGDDGKYGVLPAPDTRKEDWPVKRKILIFSLFESICAIESFSRGGDVKEETPNEVEFAEKLKVVSDFLEAEMLGPTRSSSTTPE